MRELLAQPDALRAQAGDASTAAVLERVLRGWVEGAPRGVAAVEAERRRLLLARLSTKAGQRVSTDEQLRSLYGGQAEAALQHVLPWPRPSDCQGLGGTYPVSRRAGLWPDACLPARCLPARCLPARSLPAGLDQRSAGPAPPLQALAAECVEYFMTGGWVGRQRLQLGAF